MLKRQILLRAKANPQKVGPKTGVGGMEEVLLDLMDHKGLKDKTGSELVRFLQLLFSFMMHHVISIVMVWGIFVD